jgi:hypothetical protein
METTAIIDNWAQEQYLETNMSFNSFTVTENSKLQLFAVVLVLCAANRRPGPGSDGSIRAGCKYESWFCCAGR